MRTVSKTLVTAAALGIAGVFLVRFAGSDDPGTRAGIVVVAGSTPTPRAADEIRFVRPELPEAPARRRVPKSLAIAAAKKGGADAQMATLSETQLADPRGQAIEQRVATAFRDNASFPRVGDPTVSCTITMCRITGTAPGDPAAIRDALRDGRLLRAYGELGFSAGPDVETAEAGVTSFMMFLNREM